MALNVSFLSDEPITDLAQLENVLLSRLPEGREDFFSPPHPSKLPTDLHGILPEDLQKAEEIIREIAAQKGRIVIFGDYDCDGVTATAVLWETLRASGIESWPFLPHREKHGYGLSIKALQDVFEMGKPDLVITVDNGIVAHEAIAWLKDQGIPVIVTDHHEPHGDPVPADVVLHSTRLAGVTVSWLLAQQINAEFAVQQLDLAAIGTIADQVPLYGANRSFVWHGLKVLQKTKRPSLLTLAEVAGLTLKDASATTVHYGIAPRINAMGRLHSAMEALRALVSRQPEKVQSLMKNLQKVNVDRQALTATATTESKSAIEEQKDEHLIIAVGPYHEGIIGLIASKLVEEAYKPSIVISTLGELSKASCRSVAGVNITEFLRSLEGVEFASLGGHAMAAGFSLKLEVLETFIGIAHQTAKEKISKDLLVPKLEIIGSLDWQLLLPSTTTVLEKFAPFGAGNAEPVFALSNVEIVDAQPVGKTQSHHRLWLRERTTGFSHQAIVFDTARKLPGELKDYSEVFIKLENSKFKPGRLDIQVVAGR